MSDQSADTVRCKASISGHCLSLSEGWSYCEEGECVYGAFYGDLGQVYLAYGFNRQAHHAR